MKKNSKYIIADLIIDNNYKEDFFKELVMLYEDEELELILRLHLDKGLNFYEISSQTYLSSYNYTN